MHMNTMRMDVSRISQHAVLVCMLALYGCSSSDSVGSDNSPIAEKAAQTHALHMAASADDFDPAFPVKPALELDDWVRDFENSVPDEKQLARQKEAEVHWLEVKRNGKTLWNSQEWMKKPSYYRALDTSKLAQECFERSIIAFELSKHNDPAFGLQCVVVMHNGFAELFTRADLWEGVLHVLDQASAMIADPKSDMNQLVRAGLTIEAICTLCRLSPLREQVKGHQVAFFRAQIQVLRRFKARLESLPADGAIGFFREPCSVVNMAMVFLKQIAPMEYVAFAPKIELVRFPREQNAEDLKAYLDMVIPVLDSASTAFVSSS